MAPHRLFSCSRLRRPVTSDAIILFMRFSPSLLIIWPCNSLLASHILSVMRVSSNVFLMTSFLLWCFIETLKHPQPYMWFFSCILFISLSFLFSRLTRYLSFHFNHKALVFQCPCQSLKRVCVSASSAFSLSPTIGSSAHRIGAYPMVPSFSRVPRWRTLIC